MSLISFLPSFYRSFVTKPCQKADFDMAFHTVHFVSFVICLMVTGGTTMRFLIVEDERHLNNVLFDYLVATFEDCEIDQAYRGDDALEKLGQTEYDLVLLDVMLPGADGFQIAKTIRKTSQMPILMLSAYSDEENQLRGYDLGIDEFVKKPYSPKLVMKKIEAILLRTRGKDEGGYETFGILQYQESGRKIVLNGEAIRLSHNEWKLFELLVKNPGILFSRETLLDKVWGYDYDGDVRTVDTHVKRLRQKLKDASTYLETVYKAGYRMNRP
jgi:two-component system response regulator VanR